MLRENIHAQDLYCVNKIQQIDKILRIDKNQEIDNTKSLKSRDKTS